MLSNEEFESLVCRLNLPPEGRRYIHATRTSEPSRLVSSAARNTPLRFASAKMGRVIAGESDSVEGAFIRECEYSRQIDEYWDQPPPVAYTITNRIGRAQRVSYTPDFLLLSEAGASVVECKSQIDAARLVESRPHDWIVSDGAYRSRPAVEHFEQLGIKHFVWIPDDRSALRSSNIDLLLTSRRTLEADFGKALRKRICDFLAGEQVASFATLCKELKLASATVLLHGIDQGWLYAPLDRSLLSRPDDALVALNREQFDLGFEALALWRSSPLIGELIGIPCVANLSVMLERSRMLKGEAPVTTSARSLRRYRALLRDSNGDPRCLIPQTYRRGNRNPRLPPEHEELLQRSLSEHHATSRSVHMSESYRQYLMDFIEHKESGVIRTEERPVSLPTFLARIRKLDPEKLAFSRGGRRAANAAAAPVDRGLCVVPESRAWQCAHADHYLADRSLIVRLSGGNKFTGRPWVSLLRDEYTSEALAISVGFRAPSRKVLSELIRDCVRRHGRLPETIVSDNGSDFQSVFYEAMLAIYGVHKKDRPSEAPRFGGSLERAFGEIKTRILMGGPGSTFNDRRGRAVSASHRSSALAEQGLIDFYHELEDAVFGQLNFHLHAERLSSPDVLAAMTSNFYPTSGVPVKFDHHFQVATSIDAPKKKYDIDPARGIKVLGRWFWHSALPRFAAKRIDVRLDPWDEHLLYALLGQEWVCCRARGTTPSENKDLVAMIARTALRLDCRSERALASREAELSLSQSLRAQRKRAKDACIAIETEPVVSPEIIHNYDEIDPIQIAWGHE